jgi:hypothetical protein
MCKSLYNIFLIKGTFCWRHHTNPVAKEWKFNMDEPKYLVEEAIKRQEKYYNILI